MSEPLIIDDLDFGQMYRNHQGRAGSWAKPPEFWTRGRKLLMRA